MGMSIPYLMTKLLLDGFQTTCIGRLICSHGHIDVLALLWPPRGRMALGDVLISVHALICVLESDLKDGGCPSNGLHSHCVTIVHPTIQVIACSLICNMNLAYDEGTRLDCL
jgi:hypothetical protein